MWVVEEKEKEEEEENLETLEKERFIDGNDDCDDDNGCFEIHSVMR